MKFFIVSCCTILAVANAGYEYARPAATTKLSTPHLIYGSPSFTPAAAAAVSQYYTQDALGQYAYGYSEPLSTKQETRTADGTTRGTYSYLDAAGKLQTVDYTADAAGFRVAATNLPRAELVANEETPEVAALRAQHLAAHEEAKLRLAADGDILTKYVALPRPVQDTPEVAAAKVEFFKRFEAEKLRNELLSQQQQQQHQLTALRQQSTIVTSQPILVKDVSSLPVYSAALVPASGFAYNYKLGANNRAREYLPVA